MRAEVPHNLSQDGDCPLHVAVENGRTKAAVILLDHHADANIRNQVRQNPSSGHETVEHETVQQAVPILGKLSTY